MVGIRRPPTGRRRSGGCNGGFFQTSVTQNESFTGFSGEGSAGLEWYIPCGGYGSCASVSLKGTAGSYPTVGMDYPSNFGVGQTVGLSSVNKPGYGITGGVTVPLGAVP